MIHLLLVGVVSLGSGSSLEEAPWHRAELVFPLRGEHNHAPGVVECPNGDLLVSWYRGSGERGADDVAVWGARRPRGQSGWSTAFLLADTPGFPDGNTVLHVDSRGRLWLFWPVILANTWESCITRYRVSSSYDGEGSPRWDWQGSIFLRPESFPGHMRAGYREWQKLRASLGLGTPEPTAAMEALVTDRLSQRLGWQPRCKPTVLPSGRVLLPLYSDTYSVSIMAVTDDLGETWYASEPLVGHGNIQPSVLRRGDGTLVAFMRENGSLDRVRVSESTDDGLTWGPVGVTELANPGSGLDGLRLAGGQWILVRNDSTSGRRSLVVSLSCDEGRTWTGERHLEAHPSGAYHYPAVIQARDGTIHVVYSYFVAGGKSMKHAAFNLAWVEAGDADPSRIESTRDPVK